MIKIIYRTLVSIIILLLSIIVFLSTFGIKTDKFNSKIISQIKQIEPNVELKLDVVGVTLDPLNFGINLKTIGTDLIYKKKIIGIESINSKISIKSFLNNKFSLTEISISTKSLVLKDLINFFRLFNNDPKLFVAEKFIEKGYVVVDLKLEFDDLGNIKDNFKFNGLIKDAKIDLFRKYDLNKIDFVFDINQNVSKFTEIRIILNDNNILIPELVALKKNSEYFVSGKLITDNTSISKNEINDFISKNLFELDIQEILLSSKNDFKFKINKNLRINNFETKSEIDLHNLKFKNSLQLKKIFPKIKKDLILKNQKIKLEYNKNNLSIVGSGNALLQSKIDEINYEIYKKKDELQFKTKLKILKNPFKIDLINFEKDINSDLELNFVGKNNNKDKLLFNEISLKEKNKIISIKNLILSDDNKINVAQDTNNAIYTHGIDDL